MKRLATAAALAICLTVGGIGGKHSSASTGVTVKLWVTDDPNIQPYVVQFQQAHPNITIKKSTYTGTAIQQALKVAASTGSGPDVFFNWGGNQSAPYDTAGFALDLTPYISRYRWNSTLVPTAFEMAKLDGKLYGVPNQIFSMGYWYRKDIFNKYGLKPPTTFGELQRLVAALKSHGLVPLAIGGKFSYVTMRVLDSFIEHFGGQAAHDKLFKMEMSWNSAPVIQALTLLKAWVDKGYILPGFLAVDPAEELRPLYSGKAVMVFEGPWIEPSIINDKQNINNYDVFVSPTDRKPLRASGFIQQLQVAAHSDPAVRDAAVQFAAFVGSKEAAQRNIGTFGGPSAVQGVFAPRDKYPLQVKWAGLTQNVPLYLPIDQALPSELYNTIFSSQDGVAAGKLSPDQAAAAIQRAIDSYKASH